MPHYYTEMRVNKLFCTNPRLLMAFSVMPVRQVAMAIRKVMSPNVACTGTKAALKAAVLASQHNRIKKLKNPTTNYIAVER